ncbi:MAG: hypothetical protein AAB890_02520 [Patescibacteria group bacterium]
MAKKRAKKSGSEDVLTLKLGDVQAEVAVSDAVVPNHDPIVKNGGAEEVVVSKPVRHELPFAPGVWEELKEMGVAYHLQTENFGRIVNELLDGRKLEMSEVKLFFAADSDERVLCSNPKCAKKGELFLPWRTFPINFRLFDREDAKTWKPASGRLLIDEDLDFLCMMQVERCLRGQFVETGHYLVNRLEGKALGPFCGNHYWWDSSAGGKLKPNLQGCLGGMRLALAMRSELVRRNVDFADKAQVEMEAQKVGHVKPVYTYGRQQALALANFVVKPERRPVRTKEEKVDEQARSMVDNLTYLDGLLS